MQERATAVLVVDDDDDIRAMVAIMLTHAGWVVHTAGDGASALQMAHRHHVQAYVLDVQVPGIDG